ncbi:hypothetical protein HBI47_012860 [Parastagonospora nodorum]|nr:hypothetical protein HBI47_012860 [Parastagonospora nodorum]
MSDLAYDVIIWLEVAYRNPAKVSTFDPYANSGLDQSLIRERLYEIGGEHPVNKLSEEAINRGLNESPNFDGIHGLTCHDDEGNTYFTVLVTDWWPQIHLDANGSLVDVISERLDSNGIRLQKNDLFETWLSQEGAIARAQGQLHGEPAVGRNVVPVQLVDGILAGMVTVAGYVWRTVVVLEYGVYERRRM